jgi:hypothetical protein
MRGVDISGQCLTIFEADHLVFPVLKIAATFLTARAVQRSRPAPSWHSTAGAVS